MNASAPSISPPVAEALITRVRGSAPIAVGDSMLLLENGQFTGTTGGGRIEYTLCTALRATAIDRCARNFDFTLGEISDQCCGGRVEAWVVPIPASLRALYGQGAARAYDIDEHTLRLVGGCTAGGHWLGTTAARIILEQATTPGFVADGRWFIRPAPARAPLWLFGAGHVARALARFAVDLDFAVAVFDARPEWASPSAFPARARVHQEISPAKLPDPPPDATVLIMTHSHALDFSLLEHFLPRPLNYLGVIGSRAKSVRFRHALQRAGHHLPAHFHIPIGLPGLGKRPAEIAISVLAQLLSLRQAATISSHFPALAEEEAKL